MKIRFQTEYIRVGKIKLTLYNKIMCNFLSTFLYKKIIFQSQNRSKHDANNKKIKQSFV